MVRKRRIGSSASADRLERLIEERTKPFADKEHIDRRIWDLFGETWAIMFTDLSGFSRQVEEFGIIHFLQTIFDADRVLVPVIEAHDGILLKSEGDSLLVVFRNPAKAVDAAVAMQRKLHFYNRRLPQEEDILLCIGLGYGRVLKIGDADVYGAQVNAASKLGEDTAKAWEILLTGEVKEAVADDKSLKFEAIDTVPPGAKSAWRLLYARS